MSPTQEHLIKGLGVSWATAASWLPPIEAACDCYDISTPLRLAAFLAQIGHESGNFVHLEENLNYSASGLIATWPHRFTEELALAVAHKPESIANIVYADRMGNGPAASGDGWRYRGRGLLQITGRDAYHACGYGLGMDLVADPERVMEPPTAAMSAAWEWNRGRLNILADAGAFERITRIINGGLNGEPHRLALYATCKSALGLI